MTERYVLARGLHYTTLDLEYPQENIGRGDWVDVKYRGEPLWNVDKVADIPYMYNGYIAVPITIMEFLPSDDIEIVCSNVNTIKGDLKKSDYTVKGDRKYGRIFIKWKEDRLLYDVFDFNIYISNKLVNKTADIHYIGTANAILTMAEVEKGKSKKKIQLSEKDKNYLRLLQQAMYYDGYSAIDIQNVEWYTSDGGEIEFKNFIKKYPVTQDSLLRAAKANYPIMKMREQFEYFNNLNIIYLNK